MFSLRRVISNTVGYKIDPEELNAYRSVIPDTIDVNVKEEGDHYIVSIKSIEGKEVNDLLITESYDQSDVIEMVNDLVLTYKRVPEAYRPYFKSILKPTDISKKNEALTLVKA